MRKAFGRTLVELAENDPTLVLLTGDVEQEMEEFKRRFKHRFFNLGLMEQSMISMAAGLALTGLRPVVYSITPFLIERPFEQVKLDIDEMNLPVMLIGYADYPKAGPSHRCLDTEGLVNLFHNIKGYFPETEAGVIGMMRVAHQLKSPSFISLKKL